MTYPTKDEFLDLARHGNLIPVTKRILADYETPLSAYRKIRGKGESFLFESVEGGEHLGRYSFVGCSPRGIIRQYGSQVDYIENGKLVQQWTLSTTGASSPSSVADGLEVVAQLMERYRPVRLPELPRFTGGAVGFIGYELIHDIEPVVARPEADELQTPTLYFLITDELLIFDRVSQTITILVNALLDEFERAGEAYDHAVEEIERFLSLLARPCEHETTLVPQAIPEIQFDSNTPKEQFLENVTRAKRYITGGDIIQVVGSQRFSAPFHSSPLMLYRAARHINPSPYMFLLELEGFSLVGASPEIHVRCEEQRVEIRPIAGTRPRGRSPQEDLTNEKALLADPKERAEHVMLVDLARNDIGRVCEFGSITVKDLMVIERYSHVMHIVSQVEGRLAKAKDVYDLMRATFPAGTVSGAPKVRAMQIISELEQSQRGPYAGCVGYFSFSGNLDCCITIRTAMVKDGHAYVQAGGGWVYDSVPENEFQETVNKARAMFKAVSLAETLEHETSSIA